MLKLKTGWAQALLDSRCNGKHCVHKSGGLKFCKEYNKTIKSRIKELTNLIISGEAIIADEEVG